LLCASAAFLLFSFLPPGKKRKFIDPANMDLSVNPGDNFYLYANGAWVKANPVPPFEDPLGEFRRTSGRKPGPAAFPAGCSSHQHDKGPQATKDR
jgi:hypothetical protein